MKLNSQKELVELIRVLCSLGYTTPFVDYEYEMKLHGLNKHIHFYDCKILHVKVLNEENKEDKKDNIYVCFVDSSTGNNYQITLGEKPHV